MRKNLKAAWTFIKHVLRTGKCLAKDKRLPKWLRILFVIGCIQIPMLPTDEIALVVATSILFIKHRPLLREAWTSTAVS